MSETKQRNQEEIDEILREFDNNKFQDYSTFNKILIDFEEVSYYKTIKFAEWLVNRYKEVNVKKEHGESKWNVYLKIGDQEPGIQQLTTEQMYTWFEQEIKNKKIEFIDKRQLVISMKELEYLLQEKLETLEENDLLDENEIELFKKGFNSCFRTIKEIYNEK